MASRRTDVGRSRTPDGAVTSSDEWKPQSDGLAGQPRWRDPLNSHIGGIVCTPSQPHTCTAPRCQEATPTAVGVIGATTRDTDDDPNERE